jgi:hypothetical protein
LVAPEEPTTPLPRNENDSHGVNAISQLTEAVGETVGESVRPPLHHADALGKTPAS